MKKVIPKVTEYMDGPAVGSKKKDKKTYPEFRLRHEFFPDAKELKVGKTCIVTLKAKVVGLSISKFSNETEFEIHGYDIVPAKDGKDNNPKGDY